MVDRSIIELYNEYVHTALPRREFLSRLTKMAGGAAAATVLLGVLEPNYAQARQIDGWAKKAKVAVLSTGVNPGFVMDALPIALTAVCDRVDQRVLECGVPGDVARMQVRMLPHQRDACA